MSKTKEFEFVCNAESLYLRCAIDSKRDAYREGSRAVLDIFKIHIWASLDRKKAEQMAVDVYKIAHGRDIEIEEVRAAVKAMLVRGKGKALRSVSGRIELNY